MNNTRSATRDFDTLAWGAFFIWWGVTELLPFLPAGAGALGIGAILLGLNGARTASGLPGSGWATTLGVLALVWGGLELGASVLSLPFEIPIFAILLVTLGLILLVRELAPSRQD
jgi:hypothetical protein